MFVWQSRSGRSNQHSARRGETRRGAAMQKIKRAYSMRAPALDFGVRVAARALTRFFLLLAVPLALSGCAGTRGGPIPYNVENFPQPDSAVIQTADADYKIAPMDSLDIKV